MAPTQHSTRSIAAEEFAADESGRCEACGENLEPGSCCLNPDCPEGKDNLLWEIADRQYHAMADREAEAQWEVDG